MAREKSYGGRNAPEMALGCKRDPGPARLPSHMEYTTPDVALRMLRHLRPFTRRPPPSALRALAPAPPAL